jgi:hypothetical protein
MKPHGTKSIVRKLIFAYFIFIFVLVLVGSGNAKPFKPQGPPFSFPGGKRGQEAITALQDRLPAVASRYGQNTGKLKKSFLHDSDLWLDPADNLLYLCSFDISEADALSEPAASAIPTVPLPLDQTFRIHSLPGASRVIYLDFDGHVTSGTVWNTNFNGGADIVSLPYDFNGNTGSFSNDELGRIQKIWARVAEDFAIYEIDVTTEDPGLEALRKSSSSDNQYGVRVVISPSSSWYGNAGGVAYIGSFAWSSDTPTFVFSDKLGSGNEKYVTDAASHETGHTLGLSHDGVTGGSAYYSGHGSWAPIMGVGYYKPITQWSKGEYAGANNSQDDLAVMLNNGASYRQDDHGDWIDNATMLSGEILEASGIIERTGDMDVFGFQIEAGNIFINVDPANLDPNLDILVQILDDGGNVISENDPYSSLPASLNLNLPAGTYYILIDGVGTGDPNSGYSDYASLGQYFIFATLPTTQSPPAAPAGLSAAPASYNQINLSWTDNSANENGFSIERSASAPDNWIKIGFTAANNTTYADSGLNLSTTYHYRVSAYNVVGDSDFSNTASAITFGMPPSAPSNLSATAVAPGQIELDWVDNSSNETGFALERSPNGVNNWAEIASIADNTTTYTDTGLTSGATFFYRVSAYNLNGESGISNTASATTAQVPPESPTNLEAVATDATQIDLNWQDNSSSETGFKIERSLTGFAPWTEIAAPASNITAYADDSVSPGTTYYYRVFSYNSAGQSEYSNAGVATTGEPPQFVDRTATQEAFIAGSVTGTFAATTANDSSPEILTEQTSGGRPNNRYSYLEHKWMIQIQPGASITLFANAWAPFSAAGDAFVFSYSTDDENYSDMFIVSADFDDDRYHIYPLPENLSGTLYIRVTDTLRSAGSYDRNTLSIDHLFIRTDNDPGSPPLSPDGLAATGLTFDAIALNWTDNADNELGFFIERSPDGTNGWELAGSTGPDSTTFTDNGLPPGVTFYYRVQAFNSAGVSSFSDTASATTSQADALHIAALDSYAELSRRGWDAIVTITVRNQNDSPVTGATVEGSWDTGTFRSCVTNSIGQCTVSNKRLKTSINSTSFSVTGLASSSYIYDPDSNVGSSILVFRP